MPKNANNGLEPREEGELLSGQDELFYSIREALRAKQTKEAIAQLIRKYEAHALGVSHAAVEPPPLKPVIREA